MGIRKMLVGDVEDPDLHLTALLSNLGAMSQMFTVRMVQIQEMAPDVRPYDPVKNPPLPIMIGHCELLVLNELLQACAAESELPAELRLLAEQIKHISENHIVIQAGGQG